MQPTNAYPGTEDKIEELARRYEMGLPFWHDGDRTNDGRPAEVIAAPKVISQDQRRKLRNIMRRKRREMMGK